MGESTRLKIFLIKEGYSEVDCLKEASNRKNAVAFKPKSLSDETILYFRPSHINIPKWYKQFLGQADGDVFAASPAAFFFREVIYLDKKYRFAITFGGGESGIDMEKVEDKFGLRIALNLGDKFVTVKKSSIASTMSKSNEQAIRGLDLVDFGVDYEKDMVFGVTTIPNDKNFAEGDITGSSFLAVTKNISIADLDQYFVKCIEISQKRDYTDKYPFVDNIDEIKNNKSLIEDLQKIIFNSFFNMEFDRVWIAPADIIDREDITDYTFSYNDFEMNYPEITAENAIDFMRFCNVKDSEMTVRRFKRFKILVNYSGSSSRDIEWTFYECLYAQVEHGGKEYVLNNQHFYMIETDYLKIINDRYNDLESDPLPLPLYTKPGQSEGKYIEEVCASDKDNYLDLDAKTVPFGTAIEICDIYRKCDNSFIHIKKYGSSQLLSHLFSQAFVSASTFLSSDGRRLFLQKMIDEDKNLVLPDSPKQFNVVMAIISKEDAQPGRLPAIPFFSKVNITTTEERIRRYGYKTKVMFIKSLVSLHEKQLPKNTAN